MKPWRPSFMRMIARDEPEIIRKRHRQHLEFYNAVEADCELTDLAETPEWSLERKQGFGSTYRLNLNSYLGFKVGQLHTGAFVCLPEYETPGTTTVSV